jgi:two-component system response regulator PhoP
LAYVIFVACGDKFVPSSKQATAMTPDISDKLRVFLIEDTLDLREEMVFGLTALGLQVSGFGDGAALYRALAVGSCDIVVIDIGLPGEDGFSIARHLRGNPALGLVFLTSRASLDDRLQGLDLGADAYLVKPIDVRELAATLQAVHRRLHATPAPVAQNAPAIGTAQPLPPSVLRWTLSPGDWALRNPQGIELVVSETERRFLKIMIAAAGQVVDREALYAACGQDIDDYDPHRLDAVISRLRKRTEQAGLGRLPLRSIRGAGYVFSK